MDANTLLAIVPEIRVESEARARRLLLELATSEGHPNVSAFTVKNAANDDGENQAWWEENVKDQGVTDRRRAFLAGYWLLSRKGLLFYGRGIRLGTRMLWPDRGVIRECLNLTQIRMEGGKFSLTDSGAEAVASVLENASWSKIAEDVPEAKVIAEYFATLGA